MSSLNKLIEKLAGADSSTVAESVETAIDEQNMTDPVYVEKLASAVDFIVDNMESVADAPPPIDERVALIKQALSRDPISGRFVSDKAPSPTPEPVSEPQAETDIPDNVTDISTALREGLRARIAEKQEAVQVEDKKQEQEVEASKAKKELLQNVLGKLKELKPEDSSKGEDSSEDNEDFYSSSSEDPVSEEEIFSVGDAATDEPEEEASNEADGEAAVKAASAGHSLADVLNAALSSDGQFDESATTGAETGDVHGSEGPLARQQATDNLKKKLLAKIGKEA